MSKPDRTQTAARIKAYFDTYSKDLPPEAAASLVVAEMLHEIAGSLAQIDSKLHALDNTIQRKK